MTISCDFCGKNEAVLNQEAIIASDRSPSGMTVHICGICVELAMDIVEDRRMSKLINDDAEDES